MATLHGFPILVTGKRWCVVDMPDSWAIMDSFDTVPTPAFQYQKDDSGWREAVAQLQRTDATPPVVPTMVPPSAPPPTPQGRRQFALARLGMLLGAAILGVSAWLPWATIQLSLNGSPTTPERGDLFTIMSHGWRNSVADILVGLAVIGAVAALVLPFRRISLAASLIGFLALVPIIIGITQIHTYTGSGFSHPSVSLGYGVYVAFGGCLLLITAWAMFPTGLKRSRKRSAAPEFALAAPTKATHVMEGLTPIAPPPPPTVTSTGTGTTADPVDTGAAAGPAKAPTQFTGLPTLGAAIAQLAERDRQLLVGTLTPSPPPSPSPTLPRPADPVVPAVVVAEPVVAEPDPEQTDTQSNESGEDGSFPLGWYTDYADSSILRYWDGAQWTEHTHPATTGD